MQFFFDYHIHTEYSRHAWGHAQVPAILKQAKDRGLKEIAITEHVIFNGQQWRPQRIADEIKELGYEIEKVKIGAEFELDTNYEDGRLTFSQKLPSIDFFLLSVHPTSHKVKHEKERITLYKKYFKRLIKGFEKHKPDVFAHPLAYLVGEGIIKNINTQLLKDFEEIFSCMKEYNIAFELNELLLRKKLPEEMKQEYYKLVKLAKEYNLKFSLGSDAHWISEIGKFPLCRGIIEKLALTPEDFIFK